MVLMKTLIELEGVVDVTKIQYISSGEKVRSELELDDN